MKVLQLEIKNVGTIGHIVVPFNKPLIIFYGEIKQGKSTILNAVRWCFGGSFPSDIIKHGEKEAFVELTFEGGLVRREWYVSEKGGETASRPLIFIREGQPVRKPVTEVERLLNPFVLDQNHFINMEETERRQYFTKLFAVDFTATDRALFDKEREASGLRATVKAYGVIVPKEEKPVDVEALKGEKKTILEAHERQRTVWDTELTTATDEYDKEQTAIRQHNTLADGRDRDIKTTKEAIQTNVESIAALKKRIQVMEGENQRSQKWLQDNPPLQQREYVPTPPKIGKLREQLATAADTAVIDARITDAGAQNERHKQYLKDVERAKQKQADETKLKTLEGEIRKLRDDKTAKLKEIAAASGIAELQFDENGDFTYEKTTAGMLSTSQLMQLSKQLAAKYPEGFGLDLIDRGESLGRSIFDLVKTANTKNRTILATVVGDKPAKVPDEVGVWVVEKGELKQ